MLVDACLIAAGHKYAKLKHTTLTALVRNYLAKIQSKLNSDVDISEFMAEDGEVLDDQSKRS